MITLAAQEQMGAAHGSEPQRGDASSAVRPPESRRPSRPQVMLTTLLMIPLAAGLSWAIWSLPRQPVGLISQVNREIPNSGVSNPVTAVLLNFRSYDTLLEIGVLVLALIGVWFLWQLPADRRESVVLVREPSPILRAFAVFMTPVAVLLAGYLLWAGAHAPGGAFQAGAVLAGVGVLLLLTDAELLRWLRGPVLRLLAICGFGVFVAIAVGLSFAGQAALEYPVPWAKTLVLLIELAATISIAVILTMLFQAVLVPGGGGDSSSGARS